MADFFSHPVVVLAGVALAVRLCVWYGAVNSDRDAFNKFMEEVRADIKKIGDRIDKIFDRLPVRAVAGSSPLKLTDLGKRISETVDASGLAEKLASRLSGEVEGKSPYGIQEFCGDYVKKEKANLFDVDQANVLEMCAYEEGIKVDQVYDVIAIELRDKLIALKKQL